MAFSFVGSYPLSIPLQIVHLLNSNQMAQLGGSLGSCGDPDWDHFEGHMSRLKF